MSFDEKRRQRLQRIFLFLSRALSFPLPLSFSLHSSLTHHGARVKHRPALRDGDHRNGSTPPARDEARAVQGVDGDVDSESVRGGRVSDALAAEEHGGVVLLSCFFLGRGREGREGFSEEKDGGSGGGEREGETWKNETWKNALSFPSPLLSLFPLLSSPSLSLSLPRPIEIALTLPDHDHAVHRDRVQHAPHDVDRGAVGGVLVAAAEVARAGEGRGLGHADELQSQGTL